MTGVFSPPIITPGINKLILANSVSDANNGIDFGAGEASIGNSLVVASTALTKLLNSPWQLGNNQGGLLSGTKANNTWYHCFLMNHTLYGVDRGFSTSIIGSDAPAGWSLRRIGAVKTNGSGNIIGFFQEGDVFTWKTPQPDISVDAAAVGTNPGVLLPISTPLGVRVLSSVNGYIGGTNSDYVFVHSPDGDNTAADYLTGRIEAQGAGIGPTFTRLLVTNTSSQIRLRMAVGASGTPVYVATRWWIDPRGRN